MHTLACAEVRGQLERTNSPWVSGTRLRQVLKATWNENSFAHGVILLALYISLRHKKWEGNQWGRRRLPRTQLTWPSGDGFWERFTPHMMTHPTKRFTATSCPHKRGSWSNEGTSRVREDCWAELALLNRQRALNEMWPSLEARFSVSCRRSVGSSLEGGVDWRSRVDCLESTFEMSGCGCGGWGRWRKRNLAEGALSCTVAHKRQSWRPLRLPGGGVVLVVRALSSLPYVFEILGTRMY